MARNAACAVIGLGNMGLEVARRLAADGPVVGFDLSGERRHLAEASTIATWKAADPNSYMW